MPGFLLWTLCLWAPSMVLGLSVAYVHRSLVFRSVNIPYTWMLNVDVWVFPCLRPLWVPSQPCVLCNVGIHFCGCIYLRVHYWVTVFAAVQLIKRMPESSFRVVVSVHIPAGNARRLWVVHILMSTWCCLLFSFQPVRRVCDGIVVLICLCLISNES